MTTSRQPRFFYYSQVMLSPGASNPKITKSGDYIFRNWISDELEGKIMAEFICNDEKVNKVAILYINNDYGNGLKDVFERRFRELNGQITIIDSYNQDDNDFRAQIIKIINSHCERIYLPGYYKEMALILKQAKELGCAIPFRSVVTFEDPELLKLAASEAEGVIYSSPYYNTESTEPFVINFIQKFKTRFNRDPGIFAAHAYDATMIISSVLKNVSYNGENIKKMLYQVKNYPGVSGLTTFDQNGDVVKPVAIKQLKNGRFILLKTISLN